MNRHCISLFLGALVILTVSSCVPRENTISPRSSSSSRVSPSVNGQYPLNVSGFAMDSKDLMWLGTGRALMSYDGFNNRPFNPGNGPMDLPSGNVLSIFNDSERTVWIGTDKGLCTYIRYNRFRNYLFEGEPLKDVTQISETSDGVLVVQADHKYYRMDSDKALHFIPSIPKSETASQVIPDDNGGIWVISKEQSVHFDRYFNPSDSVRTGGTVDMLDVCSTRARDRIWVLQSSMLTCIDVNSGEVYYRRDHFWPYKVDFIFYEEPYLLIKSGRYGVVAFDPDSKTFFSDDLPFIPKYPSTTDLTCMYHDPTGNLWLGYQHYGSQCITREQKDLLMLNDNPLHNGTSGININCITLGEDGMIWGSTNNALFRCGPNSPKMDTFSIDDLFGKPYLTDVNIREVVAEKERAWVLGEGFLGLLDTRQASPKTLEKWEVALDAGDCLVYDGICYLTSDSQSILSIDPDGNISSLPVSAGEYNSRSRFLGVDDGHILLACDGLTIYQIEPESGRMMFFPIDSTSVKINPSDFVVGSCIQDRKVYMAMNLGGVCALDLDTGIIESIESLSSLLVSSIEGVSGNVFVMGSQQGVVYYDGNDSSIRVFNVVMNERDANPFTPNGIVKVKNSVIVGSNDGCIFIPPTVPKQAVDHHLSVHGVTIRDKKGNYSVHLPEDESLCVFKHNHNSFEVSFGTVGYDNQPISVQYKLEGYNPEWLNATRDQSAQYSKIPAGKYTFKLREMQPYTTNVLKECEMQVIINKAPWNTFWAYLLYFCLTVATIWTVMKIRERIKSDNVKLSLAEQKNELEHRTNQMNMMFFANIAHEFRNPLTIISAPLASLLRDESISASAYKKLKAISASANSMLKLIDQMLDFNQLEMDVLKLCVGEHDVTYELSKLMDTFEESAKPREISVSCTGIEDSSVCLLDLDKFEKILNNLFTNALKHTPDGGEINLAFDDITREEAISQFDNPSLSSSRYFLISITNSGKHIPDDKIDNVFKRYFQFLDATTHNYGWGRGIGLYYVQRLIAIQQGDIKVANVPEGVCFTFIIPTDREIFKDADREDSRVHRILQIDIPKEEKKPVVQKTETEERRTILVVDDDIQIGQYLKIVFEDKYKIVNKYSAEAALSDIGQINPDLIISDVVMGKMSGYDFCRTVKSDLMYSHIPFILLTAKTDIEDSVSGLECGANAYVTKPFSAEYLQALVTSLLKNVEHIRASLNANTETSMIEDSLSDQDKSFINELYQLMDKHLSDADLNVSTICDELRISRSKFNYKLKGLTGSTPGAFFRQYKLNLAAKLLKEGKMNVSEISDMMGFASISNFSASFKKMFGITPRDYK